MTLCLVGRCRAVMSVKLGRDDIRCDFSSVLYRSRFRCTCVTQWACYWRIDWTISRRLVHSWFV